MKWIDIPPVWLLGALAIALIESRLIGAPVAIAGWIGAVLFWIGLALIVGAVVQMIAQRTTPVPHQEPDRLVQTGLFGISRNPIYLGDLLVLAGCCLSWGAWLSLILVPGLALLLARRFIRAEEARLLVAFPEDAPEYMQRVRRWL